MACGKVGDVLTLLYLVHEAVSNLRSIGTLKKDMLHICRIRNHSGVHNPCNKEAVALGDDVRNLSVT